MSSSRIHNPADEASVAVFAPSFPPAFRGGGPVRSMKALVESVPPQYLTWVVTSSSDMGYPMVEDVITDEWLDVGNSKVRYVDTRPLLARLCLSFSLKSAKPAMLYFNSFFNPLFTIFPLFLSPLLFGSKPVRVVAPRGEFGQGALGRRNKKKSAYIAVFRMLRMHRKITWHATAEHEVADIRRIWGRDAHVVLRENETLLPLTAKSPLRGESGELKVVFLGRLVEHKGLEIAIEALASMSEPVVLDVYGPSEDADYERLCHAAARRAPSCVTIRFCGSLKPEEVPTTLSQYDALLMPTAGENFGHVIAESLSVACPVITTPWTPWTERLSRGGGIVVRDRTVEAWAETIESLASRTADELLASRLSAKKAYDEWQASERKPHLFDLILQPSEHASRP